LPISYVAKDALFRWPFGVVFRALGGIPVNRRISTGFIGQLVARFAAADELYIAIAPEGTRGHVDHLKSGFYHLALQAGVPLGLGFIDYRLKQVGIGAWLNLSGDAALDFDRIRDFYAGKQGRVPGNAGAICLRDESDAPAPVRSVDE
jgi:1-acyl-sn-glycerol-3-phosphate acyltransferase